MHETNELRLPQSHLLHHRRRRSLASSPHDRWRLDRLGISVKGAIVIARYGNSWRGIKPKVAAEHGAVGCIIYSDPRDDGYFVDDVFPKGPMRPATGVQRGSVLDFAAAWPGDPLTPGVGATPDAQRLDRKDAKSLTKIPVLPGWARVTSQVFW